MEQFKRLENTTSRYAFWEGWLENHGPAWKFCSRWGKIGSAGQTNSKVYSSKWTAQAALNEKVFEKLNGDYIDKTPAPKPAPVPSSPPKLAPVVAKPAPPPEPEVFEDGFAFFDALMIG